MRIVVSPAFKAVESSDKTISIQCVSMQKSVDGAQGYIDIVIRGKRHRIGG